MLFNIRYMSIHGELRYNRRLDRQAFSGNRFTSSSAQLLRICLLEVLQKYFLKPIKYN